MHNTSRQNSVRIWDQIHIPLSYSRMGVHGYFKGSHRAYFYPFPFLLMCPTLPPLYHLLPPLQSTRSILKNRIKKLFAVTSCKHINSFCDICMYMYKREKKRKKKKKYLSIKYYHLGFFLIIQHFHITTVFHYYAQETLIRGELLSRDSRIAA